MERVKARIRRANRGQGVVEMALALFILAFLLVGIVDIGRAFHHYIVITNAAREGARYGSRFPEDQSGILNTAIQEALNSGITIEAGDITITGLNGEENDPIQVEIKYQLPTIIGGLIGLDELTLRSNTTMVIFDLDVDVD